MIHPVTEKKRGKIPIRSIVEEINPRFYLLHLSLSWRRRKSFSVFCCVFNFMGGRGDGNSWARWNWYQSPDKTLPPGPVSNVIYWTNFSPLNVMPASIPHGYFLCTIYLGLCVCDAHMYDSACFHSLLQPSLWYFSSHDTWKSLFSAIILRESRRATATHRRERAPSSRQVKNILASVFSVCERSSKRSVGFSHPPVISASRISPRNIKSLNVQHHQSGAFPSNSECGISLKCSNLGNCINRRIIEFRSEYPESCVKQS